MLTDDLPWPELGNVSRGATRGNQGQKGVLSPPDPDGRSLIQLRVQPGVLTVQLNKQATDWYRSLDAEVNHALKLTKTYWRKARRRQDYDPVADQDHMELHEWLQQLKDKVMSHLELLMQRGDIRGPPYVMPDNVELTFLRKFIERQAAGIPHNPRLRKAFLENNQYNSSPPPRPLPPPPSESPEPSDDSVLDGASSDDGWDADQRHLSRARSVSRYSGPISAVPYPTQIKSSPRLDSIRSLEEEAETSSLQLQSARSALRRAQNTTHESFAVYTASLETEGRMSHQVAALEDRRDQLLSLILRQNQRPQSAHCPFPGCVCTEGGPDAVSAYPRKLSTYDSEPLRYASHAAHRPPASSGLIPSMRPAYAWDDREREDSGSPHASSSASASVGGSPARKHARSWDSEDPPIRKRRAGSVSRSPPMLVS